MDKYRADHDEHKNHTNKKPFQIKTMYNIYSKNYFIVPTKTCISLITEPRNTTIEANFHFIIKKINLFRKMEQRTPLTPLKSPIFRIMQFCIVPTRSSRPQLSCIAA